MKNCHHLINYTLLLLNGILTTHSGRKKHATKSENDSLEIEIYPDAVVEFINKYINMREC